MLNRVEVVTDQGALLKLPLQDISEGFSVRGIDGLDPVKATLVSSAFAQIDGEQYQSARREKRNIVLTLGYEPDFVIGTVPDLRKRLYGFFMPKSRVLLRFYQSGEPMVQIYGRVESFDSPKFGVRDPQAVISLLCFDPSFYDPNPTVIQGGSTAGTVEMEHIYEGTIETGFLFRLNVDRALSEFTIYHRPPDNSLRSLEVSTADPLIQGDTLSISTVTGSKFVTLRRAGVESSMLYGISPQSNWINFFPGVNKLRVYAEGASIPFSIEYTTKLGGL